MASASIHALVSGCRIASFLIWLLFGFHVTGALELLG
jgi:hypothetical protein